MKRLIQVSLIWAIGMACTAVPEQQESPDASSGRQAAGQQQAEAPLPPVQPTDTPADLPAEPPAQRPTDTGVAATDDVRPDAPDTAHRTADDQRPDVLVVEQQRTADTVYLDVRRLDEFRAGHVTGAVHIPHDQLSARWRELEEHREAVILLYCRTGGRAGTAQRILQAQGFSNVINARGLAALQAQGVAITRPR